MRLPRPTHRTLLVVTSGAVSAGVVVVGLALLHLLVSAMGTAALDDALDERAAPLVRAAARGDVAQANQDAYAQVLTTDGVVLAQSPAAPPSPLVSGADLTRAGTQPVSLSTTAQSLGESARVRALPVPGRGEVVVVATSSDAVGLLVDRHLHVVLVLLPLLLLALIAGASRLVRATLRPVEWLADEATGAARGKRTGIRMPPGDDEVAGLARALDLMLQRVHEVEDRERTFVEDATRALHTPVSVLKGELRHALTLTDAGDIHRSLRLSAAEAERIATLTSDMLVLAHERGGTLELELETSDLREAVDRATRALRNALGVNVEVDGECLRATFDRLRVEQAVTYLVANSGAAGASRVLVRVRDAGALAEIVVEDDGPGIPTDLLATVFEPFTRADGPRAPRTAGAGLGLAVVAAVARAHGGEVTADNASEFTGARVTVRLPVSSGEPRRREITGSRTLSLSRG
ncbi:MAG: sensor histidine kinase [Actinomycetes bacterium]